MPSVLGKLLAPQSVLRKKKNPYNDPHHPSSPSSTPLAPTCTTARQTFTTSSRQAPPSAPPRPASPREPHDYLAEAREASGRDPVTGRPRNQDHMQAERRMEGHGSVYQETSNSGPRAHGTKYDLFVQEMKARKGGRWRAPDGGFYAPERRLGEFYQPQGNDGRSSGQ